MKSFFVFYIVLLFLLLFNKTKAIDTIAEKSIKEINLRIRWNTIAFSSTYNGFVISDGDVKNLPFMYNRHSESMENGRYNNYYGWNRYFGLGTAFLKTIKQVKNNHLFFRCRFDYSYYHRGSINYTYYGNYDVIYNEYYIYTIKSWQLTPGLAFGRYWKYFNYKLGAEIPLNLRGDGKGIFIQTYDGYNTSGQKVQHTYYNPIFASGGYFLGISLFGNLSVSIKNFAIGIESSAGFIYSHPFISNSIAYKKIGSVLYYPTAIFSYKF